MKITGSMSLGYQSFYSVVHPHTEILTKECESNIAKADTGHHFRAVSLTYENYISCSLYPHENITENRWNGQIGELFQLLGQRDLNH